MKQPNGGSVILLRTLLIAIWLFIVIIGLRMMLGKDGDDQWSFDKVAPWFAAIFAGVYTALYARFASQWTYLANLYNQIKSVESRSWEKNPEGGPNPHLDSWKAGFIEDAEDLHLATKPLFASVICIWAKDEGVVEKFSANTPGGKLRLDALIERVETIWKKRAES